MVISSSSVPSISASFSFTPLRFAPVKLAFLSTVPDNIAPVKSAPERLASVKLAPEKSTPLRLHPEKSTPVKLATEKLAFSRFSPTNFPPSRFLPLNSIVPTVLAPKTDCPATADQLTVPPSSSGLGRGLADLSSVAKWSSVSLTGASDCSRECFNFSRMACNPKSVVSCSLILLLCNRH